MGVSRENNVVEENTAFRNFAKYFSVVLRLFIKFFSAFFFHFSKFSLCLLRKIKVLGDPPPEKIL